MIAKIEGWLETIDQDTALIRLTPPGDVGGGAGGVAGSLTYAVLLPSFAVARLGGSIGEWVVLHTYFLIESHGQGATMFPRLMGFLSEHDRRFFRAVYHMQGDRAAESVAGDDARDQPHRRGDHRSRRGYVAEPAGDREAHG